jgi:hypothetical protein
MTVTSNRIVRRMMLGLGILLLAGTAQAQATRTWVSGVGDDVNPCSRTAPCKTFAGAISKTAAGGIISVLDPGGFGAVTITKSITIDGGGIEGSILNTGTTGVIVNATATDIVTLRNITISGNSAITSGVPTSPGVNGIRFLAGGELHVENVNIQSNRSTSAGNGWGILVNPSGSGTLRLFVENCTIQDNGSATTGGGISAIPTGTAVVYGVIRDSHITNNFGHGILANNSSALTVDNSNISGNKKSGVMAKATTWAVVTLRGSTVSDSGSEAGYGAVHADGANGFIWISNNFIANNEVGLLRTNSGKIASFGDNQVVSNTTNGSPSSSATKL